MKLRLPFLLLVPLVALLLAAWWLLVGQLLLLLPFLPPNGAIYGEVGGIEGGAVHIALFLAPFFILWRLTHAK